MRQGANKWIGVREIRALAKDDLFFYVWGVVYYHDGFVDGRHTRFCHRYNWKSFGETPRGGFTADTTEARYHEYGNGTDEDV